MTDTTTTNITKFTDKLFWVMFLGLAGIAVHELREGRQDVQKQIDNLATLNVQIAVIVEKLSSQDRRMDKQESRLDHIESTGGRR